MNQKQPTEPMRIPLITPWNKANGIVPVSTVTYQIDSLGRNEDGRSCHVTYFIKDNMVTVLHGTTFDSVSDRQNEMLRNEEWQEILRDSALRQARSEQHAAHVVLD